MQQTNELFDALTEISASIHNSKPKSGHVVTLERIARCRLLIEIYWRWYDDGRDAELLGRDFSELRHESTLRSITKDPISGEASGGLFELADAVSKSSDFWKFPLYENLLAARDELEAEIAD